MSKWRFWKRESDAQHATAPPPPRPQVASRARGFTPPPPRADSSLTAALDGSDPAIARKIARYEALERQVEEAELAARQENPWTERAQLIDDAIGNLNREIEKPVERVDRPLPHLPDWTLEIEELHPESPSSVVIRAGDYRFPFAEDIDWAERGTTIVKGDLHLEGDDLAKLAKALELDIYSTERLSDALFALATELRDAALSGDQPLPVQRFDQLLTTCPICGDIQLWNGVCLSCVARKGNLSRLESERQRLFNERDSVLGDRAAKVDRLPVLRKRLAESAAELRNM